jgi:hypothetical protein
MLSLEEHFKSMCSDNEILIELWSRIDLNANAELGFSEITSFLHQGYPLLAHIPAMRKAFDESASDLGNGSKAVLPEKFRQLLGEQRRSVRLFCARLCHTSACVPVGLSARVYSVLVVASVRVRDGGWR